MALYYRTKLDPVDITQLQAEINSSPNIVPSCMSVSETNGNLTFEFGAFLSEGAGSEEEALTALVVAHVPNPQEIDIVQLPLSDLDGKKLAVHTSYRPTVPGIQTYAVWTGCGDDIAASPDGIGDGDILSFVSAVGTASQTKEVRFDPSSGRVWIHEAYLKFEGGSAGDYISSEVIAEASILQTSVNLDLVLTGDDVSYAPGGAGTGTHGFAGTPVLVPRTFFNDGDWDYDGTTLTPNMDGTGGFKIRQVESVVHKYINKIPCHGSCPTYFSMSSDETAEIPAGYLIRVTATNGSDTVWEASVIMEIYRERTV